MANKHQVIELHGKGLTNSQIAKELECFPEYVRRTLARNDLAPNRKASNLFSAKMQVSAYKRHLRDAEANLARLEAET